MFGERRSRFSRVNFHSKGLAIDRGKMFGDTAAVSSMLDRLRHGHVLRCGPRNWPLPVPLPGEGRGGRVSLHAANCADPPQEGSVPLRILRRHPMNPAVGCSGLP